MNTDQHIDIILQNTLTIVVHRTQIILRNSIPLVLLTVAIHAIPLQNHLFCMLQIPFDDPVHNCPH